MPNQRKNKKKIITAIFVDPSTCKQYKKGICNVYDKKDYGRDITCDEIAECEVYHTAP